MSDHDPLCLRVRLAWEDVPCECRLIREARADTVEKVALAILAVDPVEWALAGQDAGRDAARIARGVGNG